MYLELKPVEFEETILFQTLQEERILINLTNQLTNKTVTEKDWIRAGSEMKDICLLIKNNIVETKLLEKITDINSENKIIRELLVQVKHLLTKFISIKKIRGSDDYFQKQIIRKRRFKINKQINIEKSDYENNSLNYLDKLSSNLEYLKIGVCRDYTFYIISIFQILGFGLDKITGVSVPEHIFIRYINNDLNINFETMEDIVKDYPFSNNENYINEYKFNKQVLNETSFMKNLNLNELKSTLYSNLSSNLEYIYNEPEKSEKNHQKAIKLNPNNPDYYYNYANLLQKLKRYEDSEKNYQKAIKLNPNNPYYYNYANLLSKLNRYDESIKYYNFFLKYNESGNYLELIKYAKRVTKKDKVLTQGKGIKKWIYLFFH